MWARPARCLAALSANFSRQVRPSRAKHKPSLLLAGADGVAAAVGRGAAAVGVQGVATWAGNAVCQAEKAGPVPEGAPCAPSRQGSAPPDAQRARQINEDFFTRTASGGVVTLVAGAFMLLLFLSELRARPCCPPPGVPPLSSAPRAGLFLQVRTDYELNVDTSRGETIQINVRAQTAPHAAPRRRSLQGYRPRRKSPGAGIAPTAGQFHAALPRAPRAGARARRRCCA